MFEKNLDNSLPMDALNELKHGSHQEDWKHTNTTDERSPST